MLTVLCYVQAATAASRASSRVATVVEDMAVAKVRITFLRWTSMVLTDGLQAATAVEATVSRAATAVATASRAMA